MQTFHIKYLYLTFKKIQNNYMYFSKTQIKIIFEIIKTKK